MQDRDETQTRLILKLQEVKALGAQLYGTQTMDDKGMQPRWLMPVLAALMTNDEVECAVALEMYSERPDLWKRAGQASQ